MYRLDPPAPDKISPPRHISDSSNTSTSNASVASNIFSPAGMYEPVKEKPTLVLLSVDIANPASSAAPPYTSANVRETDSALN